MGKFTVIVRLSKLSEALQTVSKDLPRKGQMSHIRALILRIDQEINEIIEEMGKDDEAQR